MSEGAVRYGGLGMALMSVDVSKLGNGALNCSFIGSSWWISSGLGGRVGVEQSL